MHSLFENLKRIAEVNLLDLKMSTALQRAVMERNVGLVKSLLDSGEDPNESPLDVSPLMLAVLVSDNDIVKLLVSNPYIPADPNFGHEARDLLIHYAVQDGNIALVELLLTESVIKVDVNVVGSDGCTPLALAVKKKNFVIVRLLLHASSNPNLCDYNGNAPIHYAIHNEDMVLVKLLLSEPVIKVDVNLQDSDVCTPLALAVKTKNFAIVKLLLEAESDPNICDYDNYTPIDHAIELGDIALVQLLLNESLIELDVNAGKYDGFTSLSLAVQMKNFAIVKLLLESGSDPNIMDSGGYTTIHYAVVYGDTAMVKLLLTESLIKVDVNIEQHEGDMPLTIAIRRSDAAIAELLIEAEADMNCPRAFTEAVRQENLNMCKLLIEHGYDVSMPLSDNCHSAVHLAAMFNVDIVRYLVEKCAADIFTEPGRLLENAVIKDKPEVLDYLLQHAYKLRGDEAWWGHKYPGPLHKAVNHQSVLSIPVLLRWGFNNDVFNMLVLDVGYILRHFLTGLHNQHESIINRNITVMKLLKQLYPHNLQDERFLWYIENRNTNELMKNFLMELYRESKHPSRLNIMCRTKIFQQLGYNPIPKADKLPLPRNLINFVQFRDVEELYVA